MKSDIALFLGLAVLGSLMLTVADSNGSTKKDLGSVKKDLQGNNTATLVGDTSNSTNVTCDTSNNNTCKETNPQGFKDYISKFYTKNRDMLMRTLYVLIGITSVVVLYFVVKAVRLRRRRSKTKKYGVITPGHDNMEMTPLDAEEDDEDMTVFEVNGHPR